MTAFQIIGLICVLISFLGIIHYGYKCCSNPLKIAELFTVTVFIFIIGICAYLWGKSQGYENGFKTGQGVGASCIQNQFSELLKKDQRPDDLDEMEALGKCDPNY